VATRNDPKLPAELVQELDSVFERGAAWVGDHPQIVLLAIGALLAVAALVGGVGSMRERNAKAAEAEVSGVYDAYLAAMGASPGAREVPEPANPEVGRKTREEFSAKLLAAANNHGGSAAAVAGRLQAADLLEQNGDAAGAFAARELAAKSGPRGSGATAIALTRYAVALEMQGNLQAAAEAFETAGEIDSPGQALALADAARCWALKGDEARALALYARAEKLGVDAVPVHVRQRLIELRGASESKGQ
jgi:tetratricopeptide (TPR) repeat protein